MAGSPKRSCISCRRKGAKGELVKLASTPQGVVADYAEKLPGRGAYVCAVPSCIRDALDERKLSRAYRKKTEPPAYEKVVEGIRAALERRALSLLGMARRAGRISWGFDAAMEAARRSPGGLLILSCDASKGTLEKFGREEPGEYGRAVVFSTREALGRLLGTAPVAVVYVTDIGISDALRLELGRLKAIN
jgi:uncharacterized protein